jgi:hypothetical protein
MKPRFAGYEAVQAARESQMRRQAFSVLLYAAVASSLAPGGVAAQAYPTRPVTLVIPFPPGGGNDALGRMVADKMSKSIGQQIVVDNRGGAGGTIATRAVARSTPDGYVILLAYTGTLAINPSLYPNPGYDPRKDFAPIGLIAGLPSVLVVHPTLPVHSVAELIAFYSAPRADLSWSHRHWMPSRISTCPRGDISSNCADRHDGPHRVETAASEVRRTAAIPEEHLHTAAGQVVRALY